MFFVLIAVAAGIVALAHTAPFPFLLERISPDRAVWHMPRTHPATVYLTFDDGPNPSATPELLDVLKREQARATFFVVDRHINENTATLLRRMFEEGHGVGIHSYQRSLMRLDASAFAAWVTAASDRVARLTGRRPCRAFRPHAGWRTAQMLRGLRQLDYKMVGWGWMLWDWNWYRAPTPEALVPRLVGRVRAGDIIVMHDGHEAHQNADRRYTVDSVKRLVPALRDRGFSFGVVCDASDANVADSPAPFR
jgi:peptidoglycan/xylan/chitin deacetylase (PgdA/CDA1 family)